MRDFVHLMNLKYNISADVSVINQNVLINTVKCQDEFLVQFFCSLPHFLVN